MRRGATTGPVRACLRNRAEQRYFKSFTCSEPERAAPQCFLAGQVNSLSHAASMNGRGKRTKRRTPVSQTAQRGCECLERVRVALPACQSSLGSLLGEAVSLFRPGADSLFRKGMVSGLESSSRTPLTLGALRTGASSVKPKGIGAEGRGQGQESMGNRKTYQAYLRSDHWKELKARKFAQDGKYCQTCVEFNEESIQQLKRDLLELLDKTRQEFSKANGIACPF